MATFAQMTQAIAEAQERHSGNILVKPLPGQALKKNRSWESILIRAVSDSDIKKICSWAADPNEVRWIGSNRESLDPDTVYEWLNESYYAFILCIVPKGLKKSIPLAFSVISPVKEESLSRVVEIGRILVDPNWRRKGFGSTLVLHLCRITTVALKSIGEHLYEICCRVMRENEVGCKFFNSLPFSITPRFHSLSQHSKYIWFKYLLDVLQNKLGDTMRKLRGKEITQAMLAFQCGVKRPTINMLESGIRTPSLELLRRICLVLGKSHVERSFLLHSAIGEEPGKSLITYPPVSKAVPDPEDDLWVISDELMESLDEGFIDNTITALKLGKMRWFFIPPGRWEEKFKHLYSLIINRLDKEGIKIDRNNQFRIYEAPSALCSLRLAIHNPVSNYAEMITIEGHSKERIPLSDERSESLYMAIRSIITLIQLENKRVEDEKEKNNIEIKGFRRLE